MMLVRIVVVVNDERTRKKYINLRMADIELPRRRLEFSNL
jgi:hypothetical protein